VRWRYPAIPELAEDERALDTFEGLRARVTLTDRRVIISRLSHVSIPYENIIDVNGGTFAGAVDMRDNATISGGLYLVAADNHEEWVHIPYGSVAADLIRSQAPNLIPEGVKKRDWLKEMKRRRGDAPAVELSQKPLLEQAYEWGMAILFFFAVPAGFWLGVAIGYLHLRPAARGADFGVTALMGAWAAFDLWLIVSAFRQKSPETAATE
jgi:hypothetical protein